MGESYNLPWDEKRNIQPITGPVKDSSPIPKQYVSFSIPVTENSTINELVDIQKEFEKIVPTAPQDFHITLKYCEIPYDIDPMELVESLNDHYEKVLEVVQPFTITVESLNVFPKCIFAEVTEGGEELSQWNRQLRNSDDLPASPYDSPNYWPHLTIGHFNQETNIERVIEMVDGYRKDGIQFGSFTAEEIQISIDRWKDESQIRYNTVETLEIE